MDSKTVYQCDSTWVFVGETHAPASPLEPGKYLIPAWAVESAPPAIPPGKQAVWLIAEQKWLVREIPARPAPPPVTLEEAKAEKVIQLRNDCETVISAGFASSAMGQPGFYPSSETDQRNLLSAAIAAQSDASGWKNYITSSTWKTFLWCQLEGAWGLQVHNASQTLQVNADWVAFRLGYQEKCAQLLQQLDACSSIEAALAINWHQASAPTSP